MTENSSIAAANPFADYWSHRQEIDEAVLRVLLGGRYILGPEVATFEQEFASFLGASDAVGVGNGTDAVHVALRVSGVGPGDGVITVSHTAVATVAAIELAGAVPILIDVDPRTQTMDPNRLEDALRLKAERRIKAVIPVHLYGHPADMPAILQVARRQDLRVIEDCAQSHGATIQGRQTGTWGDVAAFSFYPTKNLGAIGDGGAVVSNDRSLCVAARLVREYGWRERYVSDLPGLNSRLDEVQAAILRVKLRYLSQDNTRRQEVARQYDVALATSGLTLPNRREGYDHVFHQYVVRSSRRDDLKNYLGSHSIGTAIHYPVPIHLQPAYRDRVCIDGPGLEHTELLCREVLSLPMHPHVTPEQVLRITDSIATWGRVALDQV